MGGARRGNPVPRWEGGRGVSGDAPPGPRGSTWPVLEAIQELMSVYMEDIAEEIDTERRQLDRLEDPENVRKWMEDCIAYEMERGSTREPPMQIQEAERLCREDLERLRRATLERLADLRRRLYGSGQWVHDNAGKSSQELFTQPQAAGREALNHAARERLACHRWSRGWAYNLGLAPPHGSPLGERGPPGPDMGEGGVADQAAREGLPYHRWRRCWACNLRVAPHQEEALRGVRDLHPPVVPVPLRLGVPPGVGPRGRHPRGGRGRRARRRGGPRRCGRAYPACPHAGRFAS